MTNPTTLGPFDPTTFPTLAAGLWWYWLLPGLLGTALYSLGHLRRTPGPHHLAGPTWDLTTAIWIAITGLCGLLTGVLLYLDLRQQ